MKIDELITKFEDLKSLKKLKAEKDKEELKISRLNDFIHQAELLLKDVIDELNPEKGDVYINIIRNTDIFYRMNCHFAGFQGEISGYFNTKAGNWDTFKIDFGSKMIGHQRTQTLYENLPATELELGSLFSSLYQAAIYREERLKAEEQSQAQGYLDFHGYQREQVASRLEEACRKFPQYTNDYKDRAAARIQEIEDTERAAAEHQLARDLYKSEREQLQRLVDLSWNQKFAVYKVTYGAKMEGNEESQLGLYTNHFFTLWDKPLENGMWQSFNRGEFNSWIRPYNLISIEQLTITRQADAPVELRRWITLQSKVVSNVNMHCFVPPRELFAFDYDELRVAIEKQDQDSEVMDAA